MVSYTIPLMLGAAYQQLSAEALRQAVSSSDIYRYRAGAEDPDVAGVAMEAEKKAQEVIATSWLPPQWAHRCESYNEQLLKISGDGSQWSACIRHRQPASIMPSISLLGWKIPQLPDEIRGEASIRIR
ncbi:hypothetical protein MBH78_11540 [Oceanimonas sp. NS1]|nr:hypothetical protein [Oceanimonas sp. NS1]